MNKKHNILITEKNSHFSKRLTNILKNEFDVHNASTGFQAFAIVKSYNISLLILDGQLPYDTIQQLLNEAINSHNTIPILGLSFGTFSKISHTEDICYFGTLSKEQTDKEIKKIVDNAIQSSYLKKENQNLIHLLDETREDLQSQIYRHTEELIRKGQQVKESLIYAQGIQQVLFPLNDFFNGHFSEHFVLYKPRDIVSGDFYWAHHIPNENKVIIAVGDCTGHGVPGALLSMLAMRSIDKIIRIDKNYSASGILYSLHNNIREILKQKLTGNVDGLDIAVIIWDKDRNVLNFAGAKMPLYLRRNNILERFAGNNFEIGGVQVHKPRAFEEQSYSVDKTTQIYLLSDGFIDQFGGLNGQKLMSKRFFQILEAIKDLPMQKQQEVLWKRLIEWMEAGNEKQLDDIIILGLKL